MTQASPDPNTDRRRRQLTGDELIALFVAFTTIGSVLFWGLTRSGFDLVAASEEGVTGQLFGGVEDGDQDQDAKGPLGWGNRLGVGDLSGGVNPETSRFSTDQPSRWSLTAPNQEIDPADLTEPTRNEADRGGTRVIIPVAPTTTQEGAGLNHDGTSTTTAESDAASGGEAAQPGVAPELNVTRNAIAFQDVPNDYWAKPYIDALSSRQLIEGFDDNTFKPDEPVNRAQLATLITQAFVLTAEKDAIAFSDFAEAEWARVAIEEAVKSGFMTGFPDKSFKPTVPVPRAQALTALVTGLKTEAAGDVEAVVDRYTDAANIPAWAVGKMAAATQAGIVVNYPDLNQLAPNQPATRAEVATMIYQALVYQGRLDPINSEYVVKP